MSSDSLLLIRLYMRLDWRQGSERNAALRVLRNLLIVAGSIAIAVGSGFAGYGMGLLLSQPDLPFRLSLGTFPGVLLTLVLLGVLLTGLNQAIRALYLSGDLEQLVVAPIQTRSIMVAKLVSRMPWNVVFLLVLAGPALVAYGLGIGAGPGYYVSGLVLLLLAPLFGLSIGALIAMFLVRWLPAKRLSELLAAAYALLGISIGILAQLPRFLAGPDLAQEQTLATVNQLLDTVSSAPVPTFWAGQGMVDLGTGHVTLGLGRMVTYVILTLGLFLFTMFVADRLYLPGWLRMQGAASKRRGLSEESGRLRSGSLLTTIAVKDWLSRLRDPRQLVTLVGSAVLGIVIGALTLFRGSGNNDALIDVAQSGALDTALPFRFLGAVFSPGVIACAGILFVGFMVFAQLASTSLALENKSFDLLKAAPVDGKQVWWAKTISILVPFVVAVTFLLIAAWVILRFSLAWSLYGWLVLLIAGAGLISTNTSVGFRFANFAWTDPRRMISNGGGLFGFLLTVVYFIVVGVIAVAAFALSVTFPLATIPLVLVALVVMAGGTWLWMQVQARWAGRSWAQLGE